MKAFFAVELDRFESHRSRDVKAGRVGRQSGHYDAPRACLLRRNTY
jgi:hypothetical protein